jgi:hypothetical protein
MKKAWLALALPLVLAGCVDKGSGPVVAGSAATTVTPIQAPKLTAALDPTGREFRESLELLGTTFMIKASTDSSINQLKITPIRSAKSSEQVAVEIDGSVTGAEVADLNSDGFPEIYVFVNSAGSGSYGSVAAFTLEDGTRMSAIVSPDFGTDDINSIGYMGHDAFTIRGSSLVRTFPLYNQGDTNAAPTGATRELRYKLVKGESNWQLTLDDATDRDSATLTNFP